MSARPAQSALDHYGIDVPPPRRPTLEYFATQRLVATDDRPRCPVCSRPQDNLATHVVETHPDYVNRQLERLRPDAPPTEADTADATTTAEAAIRPTGPVMFGEIETDRPGQRLDASDPRTCDDCGDRCSASYARVFAEEDNTLFCADCRSRSYRYTRDRVYGEESPMYHLSD